MKGVMDEASGQGLVFIVARHAKLGLLLPKIGLIRGAMGQMTGQAVALFVYEVYAALFRCCNLLVTIEAKLFRGAGKHVPVITGMGRMAGGAFSRVKGGMPAVVAFFLEVGVAGFATGDIVGIMTVSISFLHNLAI